MILRPIAAACVLALFASACATGVKIPASATIERGGVIYRVHADEPFTGTSISYYLNGNARSSVSYREGIKDGEQIEWMKDGGKSEVLNWRGGLRDGEQTEWYANGRKAFQGRMLQGKWAGECRGWHPNGQEAFRICFLDGQGGGESLEIRWNKNNLKRKFSDVKIDGEWIEWHHSGKVTRHEIYREGEMVEKMK